LHYFIGEQKIACNNGAGFQDLPQDAEVVHNAAGCGIHGFCYWKTFHSLCLFKLFNYNKN